RVCSLVSYCSPEESSSCRSRRFQERNQSLLQHNPRAVQPHFHRACRNPQRLSRFLDAHFLQISQSENLPVNVRELCNRNPQRFPQFLAFQRLQRNLPPVRQRRRRIITFQLFNLLVNRIFRPALRLSQAFSSLVDRNRRQPSTEFRITSERLEMPVSADHRFLCTIFRL